VFPPLNGKKLNSLKSYITGKGFSLKSKKEVDQIKYSLKWVSEQWKHDGMNQPPKSFTALDVLKKVHGEGKRYRCVEYGLVLSEVLQAFGYLTRKVALKSNDVAYGGFGQGHVAMEVWSNDLSKWIFLDPQFGGFVTHENKILNVYEIYKYKKRGKWKDLKAEFVNKVTNEERSEYKKFLKNYLGFMTVSSGKGKIGVSLLLEAKKPVYTFQGMPGAKAFFTSNYEEVYPEINRVSLAFNFRKERKNFQKLVKKFSIKTNEDYLKNMGEFTAEPLFEVQLMNNTPSFSHYEFRKSKKGDWKKLNKSSFNWDATKKVNFLEVRAVNSFNRHGPSSMIALGYQ
jgi:hypothetical protein